MALGVVAVAVPSLAHAHSRPGLSTGKSGETLYEVRDGDTLNAIAKRFGVRVRTLIEANRLEQPDLLRPGQRLVIPGGAQAKAAAPAARPAVRPPAPPRHFVLTAPNLDGRAPAFRWPLEGPISSPFGRRRSGWQAGIDIKADLGTPILAAAAGTVLFSGWEKYYGRMVKVEHENGFVTVYAHNLQNFVATGEAVRASQVIGTVGRTGRASAYHLHFEIWNEGKVFNPLFLLPRWEVQVVPDGESQGESQAEEAPEAHD
jgi:murein DD-endopeptidase MepM/ murein hydrolase activator NlpD